MLLVICDYDKYRRYQETKVHEEFGVNRVHVNKPGTKRCGVFIYQCECGVMDYRAGGYRIRRYTGAICGDIGK